MLLAATPLALIARFAESPAWKSQFCFPSLLQRLVWGAWPSAPFSPRDFAASPARRTPEQRPGDIQLRPARSRGTEQARRADRPSTQPSGPGEPLTPPDLRGGKREQRHNSPARVRAAVGTPLPGRPWQKSSRRRGPICGARGAMNDPMQALAQQEAPGPSAALPLLNSRLPERPFPAAAVL
uniref:Uncharacterized protein n=1 Tax=Sphaerodactylus townsendi TaxID=933632 RepID=A0ACB8FPZ3_9SAUR